MTIDLRTRAPLAANDISRRTLIGAFGVAGALLLAGCAPGDSGSQRGNRTVRTPQGEYTVPSDPQRIVSIDYYSGIFLTELGITPVGGIDYSWVDASNMYEPYIAPLQAIHSIGEITATNVEQVAALQPDLVIGPTPGSSYDNSPGALAKLAQITATATIDFGTGGDWRAPYEQAADEVNRRAEHEQLKADYSAAIAQLRARHADVIARTTLASLNFAQDGNLSIDRASSSAGVLYEDLGLTFTKVARGGDSNGVSISTERLAELNDATVIFYRADTAGVAQSGLAEVFTLPGFAELPAVRAGNVFPITWIDLCGYRWAGEALNQLERLLERLTQLS